MHVNADMESNKSLVPEMNYVVLQKDFRGHMKLNHVPLDLQSNALPLSYTPLYTDIWIHSSLPLNFLVIFSHVVMLNDDWHIIKHILT